jgi:hypothetical protein
MAAVAAAVTVGGFALGMSAASAKPDQKVTICHATGSASNPWVEIRVSANANGHARHEADFVLVSGTCDVDQDLPDPTTTTTQQSG